MADQSQESLGIVYVATGETYVREAINSSASAQQYGIQTAIFCDRTDLAEGSFEYVFEIENPEYRVIDKIEPLKNTPFDYNLFLDTDTLVCNDISRIFDLLEKYDICYSHAPVRKNGVYRNEDIPDSFIQPNSGVILYRDSKKMENFFDKWLDIHKRHLSKNNNAPDQPAFREAIWKTDVRIYILPPEYNLRVRFPYLVGGRSSVKIIHGRSSEIDKKEQLESMSTGFSPVVSPIEETAAGLYRRVGLRKILKAMIIGLKEKVRFYD